MTPRTVSGTAAGSIDAGRRRLYARLAGSLFLLYIAASLAESSMFGYAVGIGPASARLASLSEHSALVRLSVALAVTSLLSALVLAVALFALTRHYDLELAVLALCARAAEAVIGAIYVLPPLAMLAVARTAGALEGETLFELLSSVREGAMTLSAICFAVGSAVFSYLFLRARSIPVLLAWLGLAASLVLVVALPVQLAPGAPAMTAWGLWLPMLVFEVALAVWLLARGVNPPVPP